MNLNFHSPFCLIQKQDSDRLLYLSGSVHQLDLLKELEEYKYGTSDKIEGRLFHSISVVPFHQVSEKGYKAHNDGEKILTLKVEKAEEIDVAGFLESIAVHNIVIDGKLQPNYTEAEYEQVVSDIVEKEIKNGEGANFVIPRKFTGQIQEFNQDKALSIFKSLLSDDYGTYWKFLFYTGDTYFIGSTPERHLEITKGNVKMNPISGTFRKDKVYTSRSFKNSILEFLNNPKEINELFMVLDEEIKMMCKMCSNGGSVIGPLLKEMSKLIHTEYLLVGKSERKAIDLLRESLYAATVTGSPVENACNIIHKYEKGSRRYYGASIVLYGEEEDKQEYLDSPILIRTLEVDSKGSFSLQVGATLVRDSNPVDELKETVFKSAAVLKTLSSSENNFNQRLIPSVYNDDDIHIALSKRNQYLSSFWFNTQDIQIDSTPVLREKSIVIIDNNDDFVFMLQHILIKIGLRVSIVANEEFDPESNFDYYLIGPGPGNPMDDENEKIVRNLKFIEILKSKNKKILGVCLGHQLLSRYFGLPLRRKAVPTQGVQSVIDLWGQQQMVGFYNTFVPTFQDTSDSLELCLMNTDEVVSTKGPNHISFQFHPESVLTRNGIEILESALLYLAN